MQLDTEMFRLAEHEGVLVGYYQAIKIESILFTKYMATIHKRGCGVVAPALIGDAIELGRLMDCSTIEVDAMAGNRRLISLYARFGGKLISTSYVYRIDLSRVPKVTGLSISPIELDASLTQEQQQGLSKVNARWNSFQMIIGLLAGHSCKILDNGGLSDIEIASLISGYFVSRTYLMATSTALPDERIPLASIDKLIRLGGRYSEHESQFKIDLRQGKRIVVFRR
jgi:hypothetical protein